MLPTKLGSESASTRKDLGGIHMETNTVDDLAGTSKVADGTQLHANKLSYKHNEAVDDETTLGKVVDLASQDDTAESQDAVLGKIQDAQYGDLVKILLEKEKASGDLRMRSKQAILHLTFTEARITQLEKELRNLRAEIHDLPDDFKLSEKNGQLPVYKLVLKRSTYDEFRTTTYSIEVPTHQRPSLEVLVTDYIAQLEIKGEPLETPRRPTGFPDMTVHQTPERLRIRYLPLIAHLERVCGEVILNHRMINRNEPKKASPVLLLRPFKLLFAYEKEIKESVQQVEALVESATHADEEGRVQKGNFGSQEFQYRDLLQNLKCLIEFLDVDLKPTFDLRGDIREGTATEIEYADLWHLFQLGDIVISSSKRKQAFRVVNFTGGRDQLIYKLAKEKNRVPAVDGFTVDCCSICFDGADYVSRLEKISIRKFTGHRAITSLEVYPLKFDENCEIMSEEFLSQGRQYLELTRSPFSHRMFRGNTLDEPPQELDAQVIVDIASAVNNEPDWRPIRNVTAADLTQSDGRETQIPPFCEHPSSGEGCCGSDYIFKDLAMDILLSAPFRRDYGGLFRPRSAHELKEEDIMLLPNWVHGFVLRSRQWVTLEMANLSEVQFENNFDELMFSESHKQTISALVETHENIRTSPETAARTVGTGLDLVKGKGTGLIILLHGEPGVGKTSTAECVADKTKRPLFPITCGDVGETAMEVERNLHHNFRMAHKWGCVLLLDEADVFLAKRNKTDLRRNAVTSVFLRSLEYYAGILFLTTNRVGGIDPAFKSRVHLTLYYPRLDLDATLKLHQVFVGRARAEQQRVGATQFKIKEKEILRFAKRNYRQLRKEGLNTWNGRQIRNAFQTAIALVEYEATQIGEGQPKPTLGQTQFEIVAQGSKEFDKYLIGTLQGADDEIAIRDQWRDDRFDVSAGLTSSKSKSERKASRASFQSATDSESYESGETDCEDEDESEDDDAIGAESKTGEPGGEAGAETKGRVNSNIDFDEYQEFLRFKAMLKGKGKEKDKAKKP